MKDLQDINKLVKISTYAKNLNKSRTWVDKLIIAGELECVMIDSVKFIKIK